MIFLKASFKRRHFETVNTITYFVNFSEKFHSNHLTNPLTLRLQLDVLFSNYKKEASMDQKIRCPWIAATIPRKISAHEPYAGGNQCKFSPGRDKGPTMTTANCRSRPLPCGSDNEKNHRRRSSTRTKPTRRATRERNRPKAAIDSVNGRTSERDDDRGPRGRLGKLKGARVFRGVIGRIKLGDLVSAYLYIRLGRFCGGYKIWPLLGSSDNMIARTPVKMATAQKSSRIKKMPFSNGLSQTVQEWFEYSKFFLLFW